MKILGHNSEIKVCGERKIVRHEKLKFLKERVVEEGEYLRVFTSETKKQSHKNILKKWLTIRAKHIIPQRTEELAKLHGFKYNNIRVKEVSSIWGSCSSKKNLNFNWKLILVEPEVMDYVIIHELAHLREMNHSERFWSIVEGIMNDFKVQRKLLKKYQIY